MKLNIAELCHCPNRLSMPICDVRDWQKNTGKQVIEQFICEQEVANVE